MSVNPRAWLAEAIATFALVFFGPLSIILAIAYFEEGLTTMSVLFISFAHGGVIALMVLWVEFLLVLQMRAFGHISGAHINPAVTIPMIITRKIGVKDGIAYIGSQLAGAVVASTTLAIILPELGPVNFGVHMGPQDIIAKQ